MRYKLQLSDEFFAHYKKLTTQEQSQVDSKLVILAENPWHPSLRTKRIRTTDEFEISVNMDLRIAIEFDGDTIIVLLDIDHHDKLLKRRTRRRR
jgi:mRNA-degrading endonuclease RelE of RelBE toxin-antitoxin system